MEIAIIFRVDSNLFLRSWGFIYLYCKRPYVLPLVAILSGADFSGVHDNLWKVWLGLKRICRCLCWGQSSAK